MRRRYPMTAGWMATRLLVDAKSAKTCGATTCSTQAICVLQEGTADDKCERNVPAAAQPRLERRADRVVESWVDTTSDVACINIAGTCITPPKELAPLAGSTRVAAGEGAGLALHADGSILAFGLNDLGQVGHAPFTAGDGVCGGPACHADPLPVTIPH